MKAHLKITTVAGSVKLKPQSLLTDWARQVARPALAVYSPIRFSIHTILPSGNCGNGILRAELILSLWRRPRGQWKAITLRAIPVDAVILRTHAMDTKSAVGRRRLTDSCHHRTRDVSRSRVSFGGTASAIEAQCLRRLEPSSRVGTGSMHDLPEHCRGIAATVRLNDKGCVRRNSSDR